MNTRTARIQGKDVTRERVEAYLPSNYMVIDWRDSDNPRERYVDIEGQDNAGWTLDGYVLPRLASGGMYGQEVTS
jgi:hypothetical protein